MVQFVDKLTELSKKGLYFYIPLFLIVRVLSYFIGLRVGFDTTNPDSTRYLLSALIQSEATVLAVVITLSLVAVQQASSSYSSRVIDIFKSPKNNPDLYILIFTYITSIIYGTWVLKQVQTNNSYDSLNFIIFDSFEGHIWFVYSIAIFAFIALVPYMRNTLNLLRPSTIVEMLGKNITEEEIISFATSGKDFSMGRPIKKIDASTHTEEIDFLSRDLNNYNGIIRYEPILTKLDNNPIQHVVDIIYSSLVKYDYLTALGGIELLIDYSIKTTEKEFSSKLNEKLGILFRRIGMFAIIKNDYDSTIEIINHFKKCATAANKAGMEAEAITNIEHLAHIGNSAINGNMGGIVINVTGAFKEIGEDAAKRRFEDELSFIEIYLRNMGVLAATKKLEVETIYITDALLCILNYAINKYLIFQIRQATKYIQEIGRIAQIQEQRDLVFIVTTHFEEIGNAILDMSTIRNYSDECEQKLRELIIVVIYYIGDFGRIAAERKLELPARNVSRILKNIGLDTANQQSKMATDRALSSLRNIGMIFLEQKRDDAAKEVITYLGDIGRIVAEKDMKPQINKALTYIEEIGKIAFKEKMTDTAMGTLMSLKTIIEVVGAKHDINYEEYRIILLLEEIGIIVSEQKLDREANHIVLLLKDVGMSTAIPTTSDMARKIVLSIEEIGKVAVEKKLELATEGAAQ